MNVDRFFRLRARPVDLASGVEADPASLAFLSTGEACAVALLLGRLDLLDVDKHRKRSSQELSCYPEPCGVHCTLQGDYWLPN